MFLRIKKDAFGFVSEDVHEIQESDILISDEEYDKFFEIQSSGKQFRLKESVELKGDSGLFDYIETFEPVYPEVIPYEPSETDKLKEEVAELKKLVEQLLNK